MLKSIVDSFCFHRSRTVRFKSMSTVSIPTAPAPPDPRNPNGIVEFPAAFGLHLASDNTPAPPAMPRFAPEDDDDGPDYALVANWDPEKPKPEHGMWMYETEHHCVPEKHPVPVATYSESAVQREQVNIISGYEQDQEGRKPVVEPYYPKGTTDNCFLLHNILTKNECHHLIHAATPLMENVDKLFEQKYRKSDRALIRSPTIASQLYQRILPQLKPEDYKGRVPLCFGQQGVWVPFGLNECIKITKYSKGGLFSVHRDGPWIPRED